MFAVNRLMSLFLVFFLCHDHLHFPMVVAEATKHVHIVYMGEKKHDDPKVVKESHHQLLSDVLGSKEVARKSIIYSYKHGFSGFAAALTKSEAEEIADSPEVVQVIPSRVHKLHTTRSWDFLGLERYRLQRSLLTEGKMGEGIIIGVIDTASQTGTAGTDIREGGFTDKIADPFDVGGGHVDPKKAMDPGLVYDTSTDEYIQFLCSMGYVARSISNLTGTELVCKKDGHKGHNLNLPSIVIPNLRRRLTVTRTATDVGRIESVYEAIVKPPHGTSMKIKPRVLRVSTWGFLSQFLCNCQVRWQPTWKRDEGNWGGGLQANCLNSNRLRNCKWDPLSIVGSILLVKS